MKNEKFKSFIDKHPSLELAFYYMKNTLGEQAQTYDALSTKATFLWSANTVLLGIVIPLGLREASSLDGCNIWWLTAVAILYGLTTIIAWSIIFPKRIYGIVNPTVIKEYYSILKKEEFMIDMIGKIVKHYHQNNRKLKLIGLGVIGLSIIVLVQVVLLSFWFYAVTF